jgi:hypothetical protein
MEEKAKAVGDIEQMTLIQKSKSFQDSMIDDALLNSLLKNNQFMSKDFWNAQIAVTKNQERLTLTVNMAKEFAQRNKGPKTPQDKRACEKEPHEIVGCRLAYRPIKSAPAVIIENIAPVLGRAKGTSGALQKIKF